MPGLCGIIFSRGSDKSEFREKIKHYEVVIPFLAEAIAYFGFNLFPDYFLNKNLQNQCGALILVSCPAPQFSCRALTEKVRFIHAVVYNAAIQTEKVVR